MENHLLYCSNHLMEDVFFYFIVSLCRVIIWQMLYLKSRMI